MEGLKVYKGKDFIRTIAGKVRDKHMIGTDFILFNKGILSIPIDEMFVTDYIILVHIYEGEEILQVDFKDYQVKGPCVLAMLPGQNIKVKAPYGIPDQIGIAFSQNALRYSAVEPRKTQELWNFLRSHPVLTIDEDSAAGFKLYKDAFLFIAEGKGISDPRMTAMHMTNALFYGTLDYLCKLNSQGEDLSPESYTSAMSMNFFALVQENFIGWHRLKPYADRLGVSEKYLYVCIKKETGKSAAYWINYYLVAEAKKLLRTTDQSIAEISSKLGFTTQSDFGKFFSRSVGIPPLKFRANVSVKE